MKIPTLLPYLFVFTFCSIGFATPPPDALKFTREAIAAPPLSLADVIASVAANPTPRQFPSLPSVKPPSAPSSATARPTPHLPIPSKMPVVEPDPAVDFKMVIVPPNPNVDFKIRDPLASPAPGK